MKTGSSRAWADLTSMLSDGYNCAETITGDSRGSICHSPVIMAPNWIGLGVTHDVSNADGYVVRTQNAPAYPCHGIFQQSTSISTFTFRRNKMGTGATKRLLYSKSKDLKQVFACPFKRIPSKTGLLAANGSFWRSTTVNAKKAHTDPPRVPILVDPESCVPNT